jgi:streptogramin lyase
MNDRDLDLALGAIGRRRTDVAVPPVLHERVAMVPSVTPHRRHWLPQFSGWPRPLFSTAKFVLAAAIVALFGGFLLAGILADPEAERSAPATTTPSPSPVTVDEMLAGMITSEDPEAGLISVENDGHRDIYQTPWTRGGDIEVGADGSVWIIWPGGEFFRLGDEPTYHLAALDHVTDIEVGPDGTLWIILEDHLLSFDTSLGSGLGLWERFESGRGLLHAMAIGADGTIWATSDEALVRFDADGWTEHLWPPTNARDMNLDSISVSDDGVVWLTWEKDQDRGAIVRFDHGEWLFDPLPSPVRPWVEADVSPDGILWIAGDDELMHRSLARFDGSEWAVFNEADGVRPWGGKQGFIPQEELHATPDGGVLIDASAGEGFPALDAGTGRFDGTTWTDTPAPWHLIDADGGPDGSVWILGPPGPLDDGLRLTVIRPEVSSRD